MRVIFLLSILMLLFLSIGCFEKHDPNVEWEGVLLDSEVTGSRTWLRINTSYGVIEKIIGPYPIIDSLPRNVFYIFGFYSEIDHAGNSICFDLVRISDEGGNIVWE